jgi:hypothetical protein
MSQSLTSNDPRKPFVSDQSANDSAILLFYPRLVVLMVGPRTRKFNVMLPAEGQKRIVNKGTIIARIDAQHWERNLAE